MGNIFEAGVPTEEERNRTLRPLRFLGMGMLIAWLCCTHVPDIYCANQTRFAVSHLRECVTETLGCFCCWRHAHRA